MTIYTLLAEREGFEPPEALTSTVFKTAAIDHSAISPRNIVNLPFPLSNCKGNTYFLLCKYICGFQKKYLLPLLGLGRLAVLKLDFYGTMVASHDVGMNFGGSKAFA